MSTNTAAPISRRLPPEPVQQLVDPSRVLQAAVELEVQLGHRPSGQSAGGARPQEPGGALESLERPLLRRVVTGNAHQNPGV